MFWHITISVKLVLYILLSVFIYKTRSAINNMDSQGILYYFNMVKYTIYILLAYSFALFLSKYFIHHRDHKMTHHLICGITYVNMALISLLFVFTRNADSAIAGSQIMPVSIETIDTRFKNVESLGYLLAGFNIIGSTTAFGTQYLHQ